MWGFLYFTDTGKKIMSIFLENMLNNYTFLEEYGIMASESENGKHNE